LGGLRRRLFAALLCEDMATLAGPRGRGAAGFRV